MLAKHQGFLWSAIVTALVLPAVTYTAVQRQSVANLLTKAWSLINQKREVKRSIFAMKL